MAESSFHAFIFSQIDGVTPKLFHRVRVELENLGASWSEIFESPGRLAAALNLPPEVNHALAGDFSDEEKLFSELGAKGVTVLRAGDERYPASLLESLGDCAPPVLFTAGATATLSKPGIAFSGARHATPQGVDAARELSKKLCRTAPVVSGLAQGVDTGAHLGAVSGGGRTTAVLPCGIMHFRPGELAAEWDDERICVVSEFVPRRPWSAAAAMQRNRTIVALSRVLVCVEPGGTGGTLETARKALKMGRPLFLLRHGGDADWRATERLAASGGEILDAADLDGAAAAVAAAYRDFRPRKSQGELFED